MIPGIEQGEALGIRNQTITSSLPEKDLRTCETKLTKCSFYNI